MPHSACRLYREHKRTAIDVFNNMIRPKEQDALDALVQNVATFCEGNHIWQNRTGALENSIRHSPAEPTMDGFEAAVLAGGSSKAQWRHRKIAPRQAIEVDYAVYVEAKGFPVLSQGEAFAKKEAKRFGLKLRLSRA